MRFQQGWAGSHLISWSRVLPWTSVETNQAWQDGRESDRRMVSVWLRFGLGERNREPVHRDRI